MVNGLGGVTICNPSAIDDPVHFDPASNSYPGTGLKLPAGKVKINGVTALKYVRAREFDPSADLGRIQRQQRFMAAMVQRAKSAGVLLDPRRLLRFMGAV